MKSAFKTLAPEIHQVPNDKMTEHAITAWQNSGNVKTPIIIQTNKQKTSINAAIKAEHVKANPDAKHITLKTWQPIYRNDAEKAFVRSYADATHIRFNRDYKRFGIKRGHIYKIDQVNEKRAELILSKGGRNRRFRPARYKMGNGAIELYRQESRTLHEGDRIRFTRGGKMHPVNNNETATISKIHGDQIVFDKDRGKPLTLSLKDKAIRHIDHAWASTTHAFQGKTVDHAVVMIPSRKGPLTTLESLYTSASRHRFTVTIVTDDAHKLQRNIARAIQVLKIESKIKWLDHPAPKDTQRLKVADAGKPISEPLKNEKVDEKAIEQPKEKEFLGPVAAKAILEKIRKERPQKDPQEPELLNQKERFRSR